MALAPTPAGPAARTTARPLHTHRRLVAAALACMVAVLSWTGSMGSMSATDAMPDAPAGPPSSAELLSTMHGRW